MNYRLFTLIIVVLMPTLLARAQTPDNQSELDALRVEAFTLISTGNGESDSRRGRILMKQAADGGDFLAKILIHPAWSTTKPGELYPTGSTEMESMGKERITILKSMAVQGNAHAQYMMALLYYRHYENPSDKDEMLDLLESSSDQGFSMAIRLLGEIYYEKARRSGQGDYSEALKWLHKAIALGDTQAMHQLGNMYRSEEGIPQDYEKSVKWFRKGSEAGYLYSMNSLGRMLVKGQGTSVDYNEAMALFRRAHELGNHMSMIYIGTLYVNGYGVEKDEVLAQEWFLRATGTGRVDTIGWLARSYEAGNLVEIDYEKSLYWYKKLFEKMIRHSNKIDGLARTMRRDAISNYRSTSNPVRARALFEVAAEWDPKARMWCALMYMTGECTFPIDTDKAHELASRSIGALKDDEDQEKLYLLGMANYYGLGVGQDLKKAHSLLTEVWDHKFNVQNKLAKKALDELF